jgi:hypothetical protein
MKHIQALIDKWQKKFDETYEAAMKQNDPNEGAKLCTAISIIREIIIDLLDERTEIFLKEMKEKYKLLEK